MEIENVQYSGPATFQKNYLWELSVECPRCSKEAFITVSNSRSLSNAQVKCFHCMFSQCAKDLVRYNLIVKRNCDNCGKPVNLSIPNQKEKVHSLTVTCANCGITRILEPINALYRLTYQDHGKACDPVFNLPLWFQMEIRDNFFWAYNREHLRIIKNYIGSKLRERQTIAHTTMVEKLPTFIKEAKNKEAILKAIECLEQKT